MRMQALPSGHKAGTHCPEAISHHSWPPQGDVAQQHCAKAEHNQIGPGAQARPSRHGGATWTAQRTSPATSPGTQPVRSIEYSHANGWPVAGIPKNEESLRKHRARLAELLVFGLPKQLWIDQQVDALR